MPLLPKKGSVLVFSLIILSIILSAAITVASVSITNQRSASSTGKSVQSFQVADSGIELALQKIYKNNYADLNAMATGMGGGASCAGGTISKNNVVGGNIKVSFYDNDGVLVTCAATDWRDKVVRIKSEGSAFGTTRVVETAVAAAVLDYKVCFGSYASPSFATPSNSHMHETVVPSTWTNETCRAHIMGMKGGAGEVRYQLKCFFSNGSTSVGSISSINPGTATAGIPGTNCGW